MKRITCFILSLALFLSVGITAFGDEERGKINITISKSDVTEEAPVQYGIRLDDLFSSNLIENGSFEDMDNGWEFPEVEYTYGTDDCISKSNPTYNVISVDGSYLLKNKGRDSISFIKDETYDFSCYIRNIDFKGAISIWQYGESNADNVTPLPTSDMAKGLWSELKASLTATETERGGLAILFEGSGTLELDYVSLVARNSYSYNNKLRYGFGLRQDIFSALQCINPSFMTFSIDDICWKNTIGACCERENSEIGIHEYLQLCSDLGADAIPSINAGKYEVSSAEFTNFRQDILDLIEYANADSTTSYYGALRSANGSAEPFSLKYLQLIGSGDACNEIRRAIKKEHKDITILDESDITIITNDNRDMEATLENATAMLNGGKLVLYDNTFDDLIKYSCDEISYSPTYYAQMLLSNNRGASLMNSPVSAYESEMLSSVIELDTNRNAVYIKLVNRNSSYNALINATELDVATSASIQYVEDGYLSSYNDISKQHIAPAERELKIKNGYIEAKIPANSISVIRITYGNTEGDVLYSLPDTIDLKAVNYVPLGLKILLGVLLVAVPAGIIACYYAYKKILSRKTDE